MVSVQEFLCCLYSWGDDDDDAEAYGADAVCVAPKMARGKGRRAVCTNKTIHELGSPGWSAADHRGKVVVYNIYMYKV